MDLFSYIKENNLIEGKTLTNISQSFMIQNFTCFQELFLNGARYGISQDDLLDWTTKAGGPGFEIISTTKYLDANKLDYDALGGVDNCLKLKIMPVRRDKRPLCVVTIRPDDIRLIAILNKAYGPGTYTIGICKTNIWDAIYSLNVEPIFIEYRATQLDNKDSKSKNGQASIKDSESRSIYNNILSLGITRGASDIHIIPNRSICDVLYRIDGTNYKLMSIPRNISERVANLLVADGNVSVKSPDVPSDGKIKFLDNETGEARELRFSLMPTRSGRDINIRFLNNIQYTFEELGMSERNVELYKYILNMPQGLIMQVGPTGSGKSTTLYAGLGYIHENSLRNIITVEDPVEIFMDGITQVDVKDEIKLTFARVARQFLRHDVDVGVIGEIRDEETAVEAVRAATTGHLVISSLHTNDSLGVLERLIRLNIDPYTLSEVLVAVLGQRLVRRLCPHCKKKVVINFKSELAQKFGFPDKDEDHEFYEPVGCEHCNNLGYKGRVAVNEILIVDKILRDMIQRHETRKVMEDYLEHTDFKTMFEDAKDKALAGITSLEELNPMCNDTLAYKR